jgi:hypothetical protein
MNNKQAARKGSLFIFPISGFGLLEAAAHPEVAQRTERIAHQ